MLLLMCLKPRFNKPTDNNDYFIVFFLRPYRVRQKYKWLSKKNMYVVILNIILCYNNNGHRSMDELMQ